MRVRAGNWTSVVARLLIGLLALGGAIGPAGPAVAAPDDVRRFHLYYVVTPSYQGRPENLWLIAERYLGDSERANEIFALNDGRTQPTGGSLADPSVLRAGWELVLPWDAIGPELRYGQLTEVPAGATPSAKPQPGGSPSGGPGSGSPGGGSPSRAPSTGASPSSSGGGSGSGCASATAANGGASDWGQLRLAADQVWEKANGSGVSVAVIDSGVDGTRSELAGRVRLGADIVAGSGRGNTDCLGTGTAIAGLIAGGGDRLGVAPGATIVPIRLVNGGGAPRPADQATAIEVAVSTGSRIVTVGSQVDITDPAVATAISNAVAHDVVVVAPARGGAGATGGLLRVAGIDVDGKLVDEHPDGAVDVVAPGSGISSLGITGADGFSASGTQYAAAFAAGTAALVRSAFPELTAQQVVTQITETADPMGTARPDARFGYGMLDPASAVGPLTDKARSAAPAGTKQAAGSSPATVRGVAVALVVLLGLLAVAAILLRLRRVVAARPGSSPGPLADPGTIRDTDPDDEDPGSGGAAGPDRAPGPTAAGPAPAGPAPAGPAPAGPAPAGPAPAGPAPAGPAPAGPAPAGPAPAGSAAAGPSPAGAVPAGGDRGAGSDRASGADRAAASPERLGDAGRPAKPAPDQRTDDDEDDEDDVTTTGARSSS